MEGIDFHFYANLLRFQTCLIIDINTFFCNLKYTQIIIQLAGFLTIRYQLCIVLYVPHFCRLIVTLTLTLKDDEISLLRGPVYNSGRGVFSPPPLSALGWGVITPGFSESKEKEQCHSPQQQKKRLRGRRKKKNIVSGDMMWWYMQNVLQCAIFLGVFFLTLYTSLRALNACISTLIWSKLTVFQTFFNII